MIAFEKIQNLVPLGTYNEKVLNMSVLEETSLLWTAEVLSYQGLRHPLWMAHCSTFLTCGVPSAVPHGLFDLVGWVCFTKEV